MPPQAISRPHATLRRWPTAPDRRNTVLGPGQSGFETPDPISSAKPVSTDGMDGVGAATASASRVVGQSRPTGVTCLVPCLLAYPVAMAVGVGMFREGENVIRAIQP